MHQNLFIILQQFNYSKNSFIVLNPEQPKRSTLRLNSVHCQENDFNLLCRWHSSKINLMYFWPIKPRVFYTAAFFNERYYSWLKIADCAASYFNFKTFMLFLPKQHIRISLRKCIFKMLPRWPNISRYRMAQISPRFRDLQNCAEFDFQIPNFSFDPKAFGILYLTCASHCDSRAVNYNRRSFIRLAQCASSALRFIFLNHCLHNQSHECHLPTYLPTYLPTLV